MEFGLSPYIDRSSSAYTFERLFVTLRTDFLDNAVIEQWWILNVLEEKQIAIDGNKLCGIAPREKDPKGDYLLNTYVAENLLFIERPGQGERDSAHTVTSR